MLYDYIVVLILNLASIFILKNVMLADESNG